MKYEFDQVMKVTDKIKTRVHPLNKELVEEVRRSHSEAEANEIIFSREERPGSCVRFLTQNTMMIPLFPVNPTYVSGCQFERLADLFLKVMPSYDVVCLQEVFGINTSELKDVAMAWA